MTDRVDPEAPIEPEPEDVISETPGVRDLEASDGDVVEQLTPVHPDPAAIEREAQDRTQVEASEGDLLDQARVAELDEDEPL